MSKEGDHDQGPTARITSKKKTWNVSWKGHGTLSSSASHEKFTRSKWATTSQDSGWVTKTSPKDEATFLNRLNSRVARYNFTKTEMNTYLDFIYLVSKFENPVMGELVLEDALWDAKEMRKQRMNETNGVDKAAQ